MASESGPPTEGRQPPRGLRVDAFKRRAPASPRPRTEPRTRAQRIARLALVIGAGIALGLLAAGAANLVSPRPWVVLPAQATDSAQSAQDTSAVSDNIVFGLGADRPPRTPDIIPADAKEILCFYEVADLSRDAALTCSWQQAGQNAVEVGRDAWHPNSTGDHASGIFALRRPPNALLSVGIHEVEISDATGPVDRASFCVLREANQLLNAAAPTPGETKVLSAIVTDTLTPAGTPGPPKVQFPAVGRIYVAFQYQGAEKGMAFSVCWLANEEAIPQASQDVVITTPTGWGQAWVETTPTSPLLEGHYTATVSLPGATSPAATAQFDVR